MNFNMTDTEINELCYLAYCADKEIRSDLVNGYIADENDYTSNFTGALRRNINAHSSRLSATSYTLKSSLEKKSGCDATIIIQSKGESKVILFEAKYPRIKTTSYRWDYPQTAKRLSHFPDQLDRQSKCNPKINIFEIFYCEYAFRTQPYYMQNEVSSCVWHKTAFDFKNIRPRPNSIWNQDDIKKLLKTESLTIKNILEYVCSNSCIHTINITDPKTIQKEFQLTGEILVISTKTI